MPKIISTLALLLVLFGCSESYESKAAPATYDYEDASYNDVDQSYNRAEMDQPAPTVNARSSTPETQHLGQDLNQQTYRKIIYTAEARMRVDSLDRALERITQILKATGGYLSNQHMQDDTYRKTATLTLRLPVDGFTGSINQLLAIGNFVESQSLNSMDVSAEWLDLESRLATKREVRDRYIEILKKRAKKVEDILAAEEKIRRITEEIEAKEGRLRYLRDQVSMSTFTLTLYQTQEVRDVPPTYVRHFGHEIMDALENGLHIVKGLLLGVISIWPILLLLIPAVWLFRHWRRK